MIARESSLRQSSFIRPRARVHAAVTAAPILIRRLARPRARIRRPAPNPILSWGDRDPVALRRPPARRAPRRPPIPARSTDASLAIRIASRVPRVPRIVSRVASRVVIRLRSRPVRVARRPFIPHAPQRIEPPHGAELRARRGGFLRRARARDDARSRDVGERLRDHRLVAVCRRRRVVAASRVVARLSRPTPRSRDARKPIETSRSSSPPAPRHRSVRHSGRDFMGFIVRALSRVARHSSRIVLDLKPMYYARRARGRRHRIRR